MPNVITGKQKASAWYVGLGNGDKFLFDVGSGSMEILQKLRLAWSKVDKAFASHLHSDHVGGFAELYIGGWMNGRYTPLHVYGPSGSEPRLGTAAFVKAQEETWAWDIEGRRTGFPIEGGRVIAHEFDFRGDGAIVYEKNGVTVRSFPAIHILDGSVSFRLDWNGRSFVFGGDSYPNKWFVKHAKGAELVVHECFFTPEQLGKLLGTPPAQAVFITSYIHTPPDAFGKIMAEVKPRHAIGYHFWTWHDIYDETLEAVRRTYDGPLTLATDLMVWNVTDEQVVVREALVDENAAPTGTFRRVPQRGAGAAVCGREVDLARRQRRQVEGIHTVAAAEAVMPRPGREASPVLCVVSRDRKSDGRDASRRDPRGATGQ
jgi:ribonuclease Z